MSFPTGWGASHKISQDHTKVSGTANLTNYPALLTQDNFKQEIFANSQGKEIWGNFIRSGLYDDIYQAYWRFEDDATDESGNSNTLTLVNSPSYVTGKFGKGLDLENGSSQGAYIANASQTGLDITGSQYWQCWFKPETVGAAHHHFLMQKHNGTQYRNLFIHSGTDMRVYWQSDSGQQLSSNRKIDQAGVWYHIAVSIDTASGIAKIYINGVLDASGSVTGAGASNNGDFAVGYDKAASNSYADGIIDDVLVLSGALNDAEVKAIYTGGADLRFTTDEAGTRVIPHEVVNWDIDNSEAEVHVQIPTLYYNTDTTIYVWYGNGDALPYGRELYTFNDLINDANLQGYWRLESDGTDETANSYDLTDVNSPSYVSGMFGNGVDLETSSNQCLSGAASGLNFSGSFSISCWVKPESTTNYKAFASRWDAVGGINTRSYFFGFGYLTDNRPALYISSDGTDAGSHVALSPDAIPNGEYSHVVGTYDGSNIRIYVNGVLKQTTAHTGIKSSPNNLFCIGGVAGRSGDTVVTTFDGIIDDVAVLDRALTGAEVAGLYGSGAGVWGSNYKGVYHANNNYADSTVNNKTMTPASTTFSASKIGNGFYTSGSIASYIDTNQPISSFTRLTIQGWFTPDSNADSQRFFNTDAGGWDNSIQCGIAPETTAYSTTKRIANVYQDADNTTRYVVEDTSDVVGTTPYFVALTYNTSQFNLFVDGTSKDTVANSNAVFGSSKDIEISASDLRPYAGLTDEFRVLNTDLSADWIATEYNNQNSPSTFWRIDYTNSQTDILSISDSIQRVVIYNRAHNSVINLTDYIAYEYGIEAITRSIVDSLSLTDTIQTTVNYFRDTVDTTTIIDTTSIERTMYRDIFSNLTVIDYLERIAKHIGKSIAYIESVEKVTPTIDGVKNSKPEFYKIDKNKPIIYTIRKG